jgi:hypothetical protein
LPYDQGPGNHSSQRLHQQFVARVELHDQDLQFVAQVKLQAPSLLIDHPLLNRQLGNKYNSRLQQLFVDLLGMTW